MPGRRFSFEGCQLVNTLVSRLRRDAKNSRWQRCAVAILLVSFVLAGFSHETADAQVKVRVERISGNPVSGRLTRLTETQLELKSENGATNTVDLKAVLAVSATDFDNVKTPPMAKTPWIFLSTGDRLRMTPLVVDDESVTAKWSTFSLLPPVSLPLELCQGILMSVPASPAEQGRSFSRLLNHQEEVDLITLINGDRIKGEFVGLQDEHFTLDTSIGEVRASIGQTQSLAFNPDLISVPETPKSFAVVMFSDGSALRVSSIASDGDLIIAEAIGGFEFSIPVTTIRVIRFYDSDRVSLASLPPTETNVISYLSMSRQPQRNRNVIGCFLSLEGQPVFSGIGVASGTTESWLLDGQYDQFRATVGIDDATQGAGSAIFKVLVDGAVAWKSDVLTGNSVPVEIPPVDLADADRITLVTEIAERGNVLDYADWCQPLLVRKTEAAPER